MKLNRAHVLTSLLFALISMDLKLHAQPTPAPGGPIVNGLDLSTYPTTASATTIADLYQPDPANPARQVMRPDVFTYGIDNNATVYYAPKRLQFYVRYTTVLTEPATSRRGASSPPRVYGPIDGDPFLILKLQEQLLIAVRPRTPGTDPRLRIKATDAMRSMIANGDGALAMRGLELMNAMLASDEPLSQLAPDIVQARKLLDQYSERMKQQGLNEPLAAATGKVTALEAKLEEITVELPRESYTPAANVQPPVPADIPAENWGPAVDGLRAATVPKQTTFEMNQPVDIYLVLENVSDHDIRMSLLNDLEQSALPHLTSANGANVITNRTIYSGRVPMAHYWLTPGEKMVLATPHLVFSAAGASLSGRPAFGAVSASAPAGEYKLNYTIRFQPDIVWEGIGASAKRVKNEWHGQLTTGTAKIQVKAP